MLLKSFDCGAQARDPARQPVSPTHPKSARESQPPRQSVASPPSSLPAHKRAKVSTRYIASLGNSRQCSFSLEPSIGVGCLGYPAKNCRVSPPASLVKGFLDTSVEELSFRNLRKPFYFEKFHVGASARTCALERFRLGTFVWVLGVRCSLECC